MKKTLLTIFAGVLAVSVASAQCTPDPAATGNFYPDSTTFITNNAAMAGVDYSALITITTITDTVVTAAGFTVSAFIDAFKVHAVNGAPAGFSFTGGGTSYEAADPRPDFGQGAVDSTWWNAYGTANDPTTLSAVQGCLQITASASDVAAAAPTNGDLYTDYPVEVLVDARVAATEPAVEFLLPNGTWLSGTTLADPLPVNDYVIRVSAAASVTDVLNLNAFDVAQSYPNPANETATISYTTPNSTKIEFKVYNMLGGLVYSESMTSQKGMNNIQLETSAMTAGMYVYTVSNGVKVHTKRMNVN
jgi:hypothetical protein